MKAKLLLLLLLANFSIYAQQYTAIPDINFEKKLITLGYDTAPEDGQVLTANIASLTSLDVSKSAISDLTGIQDFTSLTQLSVSENLLTNLDLSTNINLQHLSASKNQLTDLNVSKNTALTDLSCYANKLTALNISALTSLTNLTCSSNILTSLDVDNNQSLNYLNCGNNQLTAINVSKNTALITFYCHTNKITSLDVSNNILLEYFMCHDNQLKAINVSKNAALIMFDCLDNQLTSVDISNNPKITELACENNKLVSLNLKNGANTNLDLAFTNFKNNPDLKCIQVDDVNYSNANWSAIKDASAEFNTDCPAFTLIPDANFEDKLIALNIDKDGKNGKVITKDIASITTLDLSNSSISDLTGIQDFVSLQSLNCSTNVLTALDLAANKKLTVLNCSENQLTTLDPGTLPLLTSLNCSYNSITSLDITKNPALVTINFSNNALNSLNLKNGFNTNLDWFNVNFTKNPALSCIQVDNAQYSNDNWNGKLDQTSYFTEDCTAFTLIPDSNFEDKLIELKIDIDGKNGKVLTSSISKVTDLNVQLSEISDLTGIEGFTALEYLNCQFNNLSSLNLSQNSKLIELYCHGNKLTALDLATNTELTTLQANKNQIAKLDVSKNTKLVYINVMENALISLNLKNGNNTNFQGALLTKNPTLSCIQVDDAAFATTRTAIFYKDSAANYNVVCVNYTLIPDVNFENKLISLGIDSGSPDGKVQTSKISSITDLDLYNASITNLTGIQDFVSLTNLSVMSNQLTTLDISQNLALTNLNAGYNKLKSLDTSNNIALEYLSFYYNEITNLDLSTNINLSLLACGNNQLTAIDLSNNKKLSSLWCPANQLTSLDVSNTSVASLLCSENKLLTTVNLRNGNNGNMQLSKVAIDFTKNPLLTCILVDNALYSNENWADFKEATASYSTVDCSQITAIPDPAFEDKLIALNIDTDGKNGSVLNSSISTITSLDVASAAIKDLTGIKGFTSLSTLDCSGNVLSVLDLSQNPTLTVVNCSTNTLVSLNLKNGNNNNFALTSNFTNNSNLVCIQVDNADYSTANWMALKDASASYSLDCTDYTLIPDSNFEDKLIALEIDKDGKNGKVATSSIKEVTSLDVSSSNISDMTGIENFKALIYLDCNYNSISTIDISHNALLRGFSIHENKLTSLDISANTELFNLTFSMNQVSKIDLSQNKKLHYVTADRNLLTSIDFSLNPELESIYCGSNNLTTLNVSNLPNLNQLNCIYTNISEINVASNPKLVWLYINDNKLTEINLSQNPLLKYLNLGNNQLTSVDLSQNPLLELIFVENNPLTSLNVQNGNNKNFVLPSQTDKKDDVAIYTSFLRTKTLSCIKVDDPAYSNANWSKIKEENTMYSATCTLGVEESVFDKVVVYPNPTKGEVSINNIALEKVTVYNTIGQLVKTFTLDSGSTNNTIDLSGLPKGVYYIYLINEDAASAKKIIVE